MKIKITNTGNLRQAILQSGLIEYIEKVIEMDEIGAGWSLRRACHEWNATHTQDSPSLGNLLDTELCLSTILADANIAPHFIGTERNFEMTVDDRMRHVRSRPGAKLYSPAHAAKSNEWMDEAIKECRQNIALWRDEEKGVNNECLP